MLSTGLGKIEMRAWKGWWQVALQWLRVQARELEATIAANVAGILEV